MTEIPSYLFIVTSAALVLGAAITIRGLLGFRVLATDTATGMATTPDALETTETIDTADVGTPTDTASTGSSAYQVRDLREPIVMTGAGILICSFTLLGIAALVHSA